MSQQFFAILNALFSEIIRQLMLNLQIFENYITSSIQPRKPFKNIPPERNDVIVKMANFAHFYPFLGQNGKKSHQTITCDTIFLIVKS